ncbi:regulator of nonsense transcripts 3B isoform X2 [Nematostella vectensis]|uniref:regulator of nonsense transcripts 3B isoform X2 n=1 Tax=Nematostella vectensis TaxID=45351 RepID=UPI002076F35D|nr:regulator of nonsense transcripts 3B isoform X2 [Nematostella vectensis]
MGKTETEKGKSPIKTKRDKAFFQTKVVIRRLPPSLKEEELKEYLGDLPEHDFFYFVDGQMSFGPVLFSRAYINFKNQEDIIKFRDQFDGSSFFDNKGNEYPAVVEYAPYQGVPRKKNRKDAKCGTIDEDKDYQSFLQSLEEETEPLPSVESHLEEIEARKEDNSKKSTPLLEFLKMKRSMRATSRQSQGRGGFDKRKRIEKSEESSKGVKKGGSGNKDSKTPPREEKNKEVKRSEGSQEQRKDEDKKLTKDSKGRPESARSGGRGDDRRSGGRRERREIANSDSRGPRDNKNRRDEEPRRDSRPNSRKERGPYRGADNATKSRDESDNKNETKADTESATGSAPRTTRKEPDAKEERREVIRDRGDGRQSRVRNKDRPDREIYQPGRARTRPTETNEKDVKPSGEKRDDGESKRDRDRDKNRDKNRDRNREREKNRERDRRDRDRDRGKERERNRDKDRYRGKPRDVTSGDAKPKPEETGKAKVEGTGATREEEA